MFMPAPNPRPSFFGGEGAGLDGRLNTVLYFCLGMLACGSLSAFCQASLLGL